MLPFQLRRKGLSNCVILNCFGGGGRGGVCKEGGGEVNRLVTWSLAGAEMAGMVSSRGFGGR